jgi:hypothetical protein
MDRSPIPFSDLLSHSPVLGIYDLRNSSGSLTIFAAIRRASSRIRCLRAGGLRFAGAAIWLEFLVV